MKRIFIGIDGTSQAAFYDKYYSNVYRTDLALAFNNRDGSPQLFIYFSGVGAACRKYLGLTGKAFGQGIDEIILQAYVNLVTNYESGDKIYIFGFSRGAVAARALTGLISYSGLLRYEYSEHVAAAWYYFVGDDERAGSYQQEKPLLTHKDVKVEFLGVWDTVYGINTWLARHWNAFTELRFRNFRLNPCVKTGVHILAVDDTRIFFQPMLWDGVSTPEQNIEQIWMPGVHGDIGGGYSPTISTVSLFTMLVKLAQYCPDVDYDKEYIEFVLPLLDDEVVIHDEWAHDFLFRVFEQKRKCENTKSRTIAASAIAQLARQEHPVQGNHQVICAILYSVQSESSRYDVPSGRGGGKPIRRDRCRTTSKE